MNADDVRRVLLVRAFETPPATPWSTADAAWASAEAARQHGEQADAVTLVAARAAFAARRLAERDPAVARTLEPAHLTAGWGAALVLLAFVLGGYVDTIGPSERLNIVALPMLGMLGWNLVVYAVLAFGALRGAGPGAARRWLRPALGWLTRWRSGAPGTPPLARFAGDWAEAAWPLTAQRSATVLHAAAAAFAAGMLASLYWRGLGLEYRAGWDSTFVSLVTPEAVHRLLAVTLAPAQALGGFELPTPEQVAALRFSVGQGENAERWIHAWALTVALVVLLPRALLAALAGWRARRLARALPLALEAPYFRRLLPRHAAPRLAVRVLPYNHTPDAALRPGLQALLERALQADIALDIAASLPPGSEDELDRHLPAPGVTEPRLLPLFALTATPERETHGAFLSALAAHQGGAALTVLIDESAFRRRFDATRLAQRRAAWRAMLADVGQRPVFADLSAPEPDAIDVELGAAAPRARAEEPS